MKRNVLIVEDNKACLDALVEITHKCDSAGAIFCAENKETAYTYAIEEKIDLFLIDIILDSSDPQDVSGMLFAERIRQMEQYRYVPIIFITSLIDEQMSAFHNLQSFGYIEKPFDVDKLSKLITLALNCPLDGRGEKKIPYTYYRKDGVFYSIENEKIICIESRDRRLFVYAEEETIEIRYKTIQSIFKGLPKDEFIQCSRNCLINRKYIKSIDMTNRYIRMKNGMDIEIGRVVKKKFFEELGYDN